MTNDNPTLDRPALTPDLLLNSARDFFWAKRGIAPEKIQLDSELENLEIDSLDLAEFRMDLEERYDLFIETDSLLELASVGDVIDLVIAEAVSADSSTEA